MPDSVVRISAPTIRTGEETVRVAFAVGGLDPAELWFEVGAEYRKFVDDSCDAAVAALLIPAMAAGRPMVVEGALSARLHWNLTNTVVPVTVRQFPFLHAVRIEPATLRTDEPAGTAVLTGVSRGVDSFSALQDHLSGEVVSEDFRVTHLLFGHMGQHGYGDDLEDRVAIRWTLTQEVAGMLGVPVIRVDTNTPDFYPPEHDSRLNWAATMTVRSASAPLLLQRGVRRFYFASGCDWSRVRVAPTRSDAEADPILLPALGSERVDLLSVGLEYDRVEKTRRIADFAPARRYLEVCILEGGSNCSRCEKCLRTLLTLEVLGRLEDFRERFDLDVYRRHRAMYIARVMADPHGLYSSEILGLMRSEGFAVPMGARLRLVALRLWRLVPHRVRARLRGHG